MTNHRLDLISTSDGSPTVRHSRFDETYHSIHGAVTESTHVFIRAGLEYFLKKHPGSRNIKIFEMGLGTGLNALLTYRYLKEHDGPVCYHAVEKFPLEAWQKLNYARGEDERLFFERLHTSPWDGGPWHKDGFMWRKYRMDLMDFDFEPLSYHVIYYDAFSPVTQPDLWTPVLYARMYEALVPGGVWVTYVAKGQVRRDLQAVGFRVERLAGPPGKREMLRAVKV